MPDQDYEGYDPDPPDDWDVIEPRGREVRNKALAKRPPPPRNKVTPTRILAQEKQRRALELRKGGATYDQIAQAVGYGDASGARKAIQRAFGQVIQEPATELRTLQIERLNHMLLVIWPDIQAGHTRAIQTGLQIMDKLDRLMGTEAAQEVAVNVNHQGAVLVIDGNQDEYVAHLKRMAGAIQAGSTDLGSVDLSGKSDSAIWAETPEDTSEAVEPLGVPVPPPVAEADPKLLTHTPDAGGIVVTPRPVDLSGNQLGVPPVAEPGRGYSFTVEPGEEDATPEEDD